MKYMTYKKLKKLLSEGITEITFTKSDGTKRVIKATLDQSYIANVAGFTTSEPKTKKAVNTSIVSCIDTEINQWRSFRVDSVTSVEK